MIAAHSEPKLSVEIRKVGEQLPFVDLDALAELGQLLVKFADLAQALELELHLLRDMEAGHEMRSSVRGAIDAQFSASDDETADNVIISDFGRKP